jgi:hypothetical protein
MLFSLAVALMVLLVAAFWVYQGLFNSVLMFLNSVVACMVAFGFHEDLNSVWNDSIGPGLGLPLALILIFLATLLGLRFITDKLIPDGLRLPVAVDFAGGGIAGFFTGMILIGTALIAAQMTPISPSMFGFERISANATGVVTSKSLMLNPDGFTLGLINMLSNGRFGGGNPYGHAKPELLTQLYSERAMTQVGDRFDIPPDAVKVLSCRDARQVEEVTQSAPGGGELKREFAAQEASPANKFLVCKVQIEPSAAPKEKSEIRFRLPQFRVVGPPPVDGGPAPKAILATAMSDIYLNRNHNMQEVKKNQARRLVRFGPQTDFLLSPDKTPGVKKGEGYSIEVAFEVPEDFNPWYVEFKHGARSEITKQHLKQGTETKQQASESPAKEKEEAEETAGENESSDAATEEADKNAEESTDEAVESSTDESEDSDSAEESEDDAPKTAKKSSKPKVGQEQGGALNVADAVEQGTDVTDKLPISLDKTDQLVSQALAGGNIGEGHFWIEMPDEETPEDKQVTRFQVPEGKKMLQLGAERNEALSMYGRAMNYASTVAAQIKITTADDRTYFAQGVYSIAKIGGKWIVEIQYHPDAEVPERCLQKSKKLTPDMMKKADPKERRFGYLFLVDPGVKITAFSSGGKGGKQQLDIEVPE